VSELMCDLCVWVMWSWCVVLTTSCRG